MVLFPLSPRKETHNERCGFFVFTNERNIFQLESGNKKQNTRSVFVVSMLVLDCLLGSRACKASNPSRIIWSLHKKGYLKKNQL